MKRHKPTTKKPSRPLTWADVEYWLNYGGNILDWTKHRRIDRRLLSIGPVFHGLLWGLRRQGGQSAKQMADLVVLTKRFLIPVRQRS